MKDKAYEKNRVMNGHSPHKMLKMEQEKALEKKKEKKDIFSIDNFEWKNSTD